MANLDAARGLRAIRNAAGTAAKIEPYTIAASTTVFEGTPVALNASGLVIAYTGTATGERNALGVAVHHRSASDSSSTIKVYDDPAQEYEIQSDDNTLTIASDLIGRNFAVLTPAAGSATLLQSTAELDGNSGTSINTSTTLRPYKGLRFSTASSNDNSLTNNVVVVKFNQRNHIFAAEVGGV